jgi:hypothetical protein
MTLLNNATGLHLAVPTRPPFFLRSANDESSLRGTPETSCLITITRVVRSLGQSQRSFDMPSYRFDVAL